MLAVYGPLFGGFASLAMMVNMLLVFAGMSLLGASLTLPGIAGLVLTVGMSVDSNVLIYERVREEKANGRSAFSALAEGYGRALTAVIDSNLTALIAGVLLFGFGSGPIRGFATTLTLGLLPICSPPPSSPACCLPSGYAGGGRPTFRSEAKPCCGGLIISFVPRRISISWASAGSR
jgi:hypothetical protein